MDRKKENVVATILLDELAIEEDSITYYSQPPPGTLIGPGLIEIRFVPYRGVIMEKGLTIVLGKPTTAWAHGIESVLKDKLEELRELQAKSWAEIDAMPAWRRWVARWL